MELTVNDKKTLQSFSRLIRSFGFNQFRMECHSDEETFYGELSHYYIHNNISDRYGVILPEVKEILYKLIDQINEDELVSNVIYLSDKDNVTGYLYHIIFDLVENKIDFEVTVQFIEQGVNEGDGISSPKVRELLFKIEDSYPELKEYDTLIVEFEGSGDSGSINTNFVEGPEVPDELLELFYNVLSRHHPGWEINEGSTGSFTVLLRKGQIYYDYFNFIESGEDYEIISVKF